MASPSHWLLAIDTWSAPLEAGLSYISRSSRPDGTGVIYGADAEELGGRDRRWESLLVTPR
jgi:hypothetical protein